MDIKGYPFDDLIEGTSNPGRIERSPGGVARNVAHNLALLGVPVSLLGVVGNDESANHILAEVKGCGIDISNIRILENQRTSTYLSVFDKHSDLHVAVSDMDITGRINKTYIEEHRELFRKSRFVVLDTNLDTEALQCVVGLCREFRIPCLIEPVSVRKAGKIQGIPGKMEFISPNLSELELLLGRSIDGVENLENACVRYGMKFRQILVTLGKKGAFHYENARKKGTLHPPFPTEVVDTNGAGDAFVSGFVCGFYQGYDVDRCIRLGQAVSHFCLQSTYSVDPVLSLSNCLSLMDKGA